MALLSDIDWLIILAVGGFLLLGNGNPQLLRTVGRWYGRALHLKQELLSEVTRAADLPTPSADRPLSLRTALLGLESDEAAHSRVPLAVGSPPLALATATVAASPPPAAMTWVNSLGPQQWSVASFRVSAVEKGAP
jgi:Sec-independent protein translocase protein TatA